MAKFQPAFGVMKSMNFENIGTAYLGGFMKERSKMNNTLRQLAMGAGGTGSSAAQRAQLTKQKMNYDLLSDQVKQQRRTIRQIDDDIRAADKGELSTKKWAQERARLDLQEQERMSQKSITKRDAEILKAGREKEKDEKRVGKAQRMYSHTYVADIGRALEKDFGGFSEANDRQSFAEAYQNAKAGSKGQIKNRAKQILMSKFEPDMDPNAPLYKGSTRTKAELINNYLDDHLLSAKSTTSSEVLQKQREDLEKIHSKKIRKAQGASRKPLSTDERRKLRNVLAQDYLDSLGDRDLTSTLKEQKALEIEALKAAETKTDAAAAEFGSVQKSVSPQDLYGEVQLSSEYDLPASMMDELFYVPGRQITDPAILDDVDEIGMEEDFDPTLGLGRARVELGGGQISDTVQGQRPERMRGVETGDVIEGPTTQDFTATAAGAPSVRREARLGRERDPVEESMVPEGEILPMRDSTIRRYTYEPPVEIPDDPADFENPRRSFRSGGEGTRSERYFEEQESRQPQKVSSVFDPRLDPAASITDPRALDGQDVFEANADLLKEFGEQKPNLKENALDVFEKKGTLSNLFRRDGRQSQQDRIELAATEAAVRREIDEEQVGGPKETPQEETLGEKLRKLARLLRSSPEPVAAEPKPKINRPRFRAGFFPREKLGKPLREALSENFEFGNFDMKRWSKYEADPDNNQKPPPLQLINRETGQIFLLTPDTILTEDIIAPEKGYIEVIE